MIRYIQGDIFRTPAETIANAVNTDGVMGKGIALTFKKRYPAMFKAYRKACENGSFTIGRLMLYHGPDYRVLLFPTKEHWRNPSKMEYIEAGLEKFVATYAQKNISSIAFPRLGCGNGELDWNDVRSLMENYLKKLPIDIYIYQGPSVHLLPEHRMQKITVEWLRENGRDMSFYGLTDDIGHESALAPISFEYKDTKVSAVWNDGIDFDCDGEQYRIDESAFYELWDEIRSQGIVSTADKSEAELFAMALLEYMGYISSIKYTDADLMSVQLDGYQINMGLKRAFLAGEAV
jgi:O-acetyl-ADP-ribose deacetylase (regulator of RNase III)